MGMRKLISFFCKFSALLGFCNHVRAFRRFAVILSLCFEVQISSVISKIIPRGAAAMERDALCRRAVRTSSAIAATACCPCCVMSPLATADRYKRGACAAFLRVVLLHTIHYVQTLIFVYSVKSQTL